MNKLNLLLMLCVLSVSMLFSHRLYAQTSQSEEGKAKGQKTQQQATLIPADIKRAVPPSKNNEKPTTKPVKSATSVPVRKHPVNPHARKSVVSPATKQDTNQLISALEKKLSYLKSLPDAPEIQTQIVQIEQQLTKAYEQKSFERECKPIR